MSKPSMEDPAVAALVEKEVKKAVKAVKSQVLIAVKETSIVLVEFAADKAVKKAVKDHFKGLTEAIKEAA